VQWRSGVSVTETSDGAVVVAGPAARVALPAAVPAVRDALQRIAPPGEDEEHLARLVADGNGGLARWYYYLERLTRRGLVCYAVHADQSCLATLVPLTSAFVVRPHRLVGRGQYVLSRFAYLRREGAESVLESPLSHARVVVNDPRTAALVGGLATPGTVTQLASRVHGLSKAAVAGVLAILLRAGMILEVGAGGTTSEDEDAALQTWAFHDLLFHARSRMGRTDAPYGGTYRFAGQTEPPPALKPPPAGEGHNLFRPDLARLEREDPPLAQVQERRRSVRTFDREAPITAGQLGEFLFRVARVRDCRAVELETPDGPQRMELTSRPYPAGGGLYELEFYVAVQSCVGLAAGLYHHDPAGHRLTRLPAEEAEVAALLADAADSTGAARDELQVLLILAARFPRLAWKYESIAYALTLKHVGVLYQTMYLAATAMGLAPCAVGGGDSDLFARAAGTDYGAETSVGEFLLGSRRPDPPGPDRRAGS
jgi:SagB-type dehydrogenase family enzyme